ncbi:hypothetical protein CAEBREN_02474 [Caenorhabditis brenneri]|uniref:NR LBD domain-containing protein n=1 Tax=Caenorhabditis brenneri TaxID=135651 RepID=G0PIH7_CAEBE|nr:hypothetical protein CAEBREN_02474 [Caenorhabditis brenneri]
MGMKPKNIQCNQTKSITPTMEQFVGRPSIVMFKSSPSSKNYNFIDVTGLISQAAHILQEGAPVLFNPDLSQLRRLSQGNVKLPNNYKKLKFIGEKHAHHIWKSELLATARWLICFDEFTKMAPKLQMQLLQSVWHVNARIEKVIKTSQLWHKLGNQLQIVHLCNEFYIELENTKFDVSWMTSYPFEFLDGIDDNCKIEELMKTIRDLKLTEVEVTYMAAQLCFQYAQARFPRSEISEACECFQEILANDLHKYYMEKSKIDKNYAARLAIMMRINQGIQTSIRNVREKTLIAKTFDIFNIEFSHPEMFVDSGC